MRFLSVFMRISRTEAPIRIHNDATCLEVGLKVLEMASRCMMSC